MRTALITLLALTACSPPVAVTREEAEPVLAGIPNSMIVQLRGPVHVFTDGLTGCQYLFTANLAGGTPTGGITPRIGAEGEHICINP